MVIAITRGVVLGLLLVAGGLTHAWAQQRSIYSCVDAKGRRLTSDRPIAECMDREQKEFSPSGTVRRIVKPTLSAHEAALEEEKARKAAEEKARLAEERRREKLLLARYPDRNAHDKERASAMRAVDDVVAAAAKRVEELQSERVRLRQEEDFYIADPTRMPHQLKRQIDENEQHQAAQKRFVAAQEEEKRRVAARFDEELGKLQQLWAARRTSAAGAPARH